MSSPLYRLASLAFLATFGLAGATRGELVAYWSFDEYTETGDNPAGTPQGNHEGWFEDLSGNGHKAYAADLTNADYVPMAPGRTGNAFYSLSPPSDAQRGALAVVQHTDLINFDGEDFTISFWEKVAFRDVMGNGWAPGRGRTQWFMKAPFMPPGAVGSEGYGLNLTQNHFDFVSNNTDNFGQTSLGARFTYPSGAQPDDSGQWAHWAITGSYDSGADEYAVTAYLNASPVDWDGATGTSFSVPADVIDNEGDLTLGGFFRNESWSHQRFISWNMSAQGAGGESEGWLDDFAMWSVLLDEEQIASLADGSATPLNVLGGGPKFQFNSVRHDASLETLSFTWDSQPGKLYALRSEAAPTSGDPANWPIVAGNEAISATPPENALSIPFPASATRLFVVEEFDAPPMEVFADDFESGQGTWTTGSHAQPGAVWELGEPSSGPNAARSGSNCFATNLSGDYTIDLEIWLRSPSIDLTDAPSATLRYWQWTDIEPMFDSGSVSILDASDESVLAVLRESVDGTTADWEEVATELPTEALGKNVILEFRLLADDFQVFPGWYLDDVQILVP